MILISHPRSGSEFLLRGAVDCTYDYLELFNLDNPDLIELHKELSFGQRIAIMKKAGPKSWHKIHGYQLRLHLEQQMLAPVLMTYLRNHKEMYFLKRENVRKSIVSEWVSFVNQNYHKDPAKLVKRVPMVYSDVFQIYQTHHMDTLWAETFFDYTEKFTLEGLLDGSNLPKTFQFDPQASTTIRRDTWKLDMIPNIEQVERWMDDLEVPGSLNTP